MRNVAGKLTLEVPVTATRAGNVHFPASAVRTALPWISSSIDARQTEGLMTLKGGLAIHWRFDPRSQAGAGARAAPGAQ